VPSAIPEEGFKQLHKLKSADAVPLKGEMMNLDGTDAYLSIPEGAETPLPGVVLVHEWWGLNDNIKLWADRLAALGYAALAVDLYGGEVATTPDEAMELMKSVDKKQAVKKLETAHAFLAKDERVQANKRAAIGWCFGGGMVFQLALNAPTLDGAVIYYGHVATKPKVLKNIKAEVLGIFGDKDESIPPKTVDAFDQALDKAKVKHTIYRYDAVHAFANPSNPDYDTEAAEDAWNHVQEFLARVLDHEATADGRP
jgi:carboxymethylenebutenolidase